MGGEIGSGGPPRLLIVEDDDAQREMLCEILLHEGFEVEGYATGRDALAHVGERTYAAAIVDHRLPDLSGIQVLERIRALDDRIPVIVHTAFGTFASARDAVNLGAFAFIEKPSDPEDLVRYVHRAVQRSMELALFRSQERYRNLTEISPVGIFHADAEGRYTYVNQRWCEIAGLTPEEARGEGWLCAVHPQDRQRVHALWQEAIAEGSAFQAELRFQHPGGRITWVYGQTKPEAGVEGSVAGFVGTVTDVTGRKLAEASLRLLDKALQQAQVALCITTAGGAEEQRIVYVNPAFARLTGYDEQELIGQHLELLYGRNTDLEVLRRRQRLLARGESFAGELIHYRKDGRELAVKVRVDPVRGDEGAISHWVALYG